MKAESVMNTESKWIEVISSKESGEASGKVYEKLSDLEKKRAQNIIGYRKQFEKEVFYVDDNELARRIFNGFCKETERRF